MKADEVYKLEGFFDGRGFTNQEIAIITIIYLLFLLKVVSQMFNNFVYGIYNWYPDRNKHSPDFLMLYAVSMRPLNWTVDLLVSMAFIYMFYSQGKGVKADNEDSLSILKSRPLSLNEKPVSIIELPDPEDTSQF